MRPAAVFFFLLCALICRAQKVELPTAKFITGDNPSYSFPSWEDTKWPEIKTSVPWEYQGYDQYDGFAWYRFHLIFPRSLKERSLWKDSIRIFLGKVDDACEVYLNASLIGKSGSFPDDKAGYITTWDKTLEFHFAINSSFFNLGGENILSVRVYDGGGAGGFFGGVPYANMIDLIDAVNIDNNYPVKYLSASKASKEIFLKNSSSQQITGNIHFDVINLEKGDTLKNFSPVNLPPFAKKKITFPVNLAGRNNILYSFEESRSHKTIQLIEIIPYILTPKPGEHPKINSAKVFGVRPNSPFLYKIAATGKKPLRYAVDNLPQGLQVNAENGIITGYLKNKGEYKMTMVVKNSLGKISKECTIKCGDLLSLTPPMGWNSWNCWGLTVSDEKLRTSARAMINKGLVDHGWAHLNIDDGWEAGARNANGEIIANNKFPDMKKTGDWLHANGLKFGIYSSPGPKTCGGFLGSYQHEMQDAITYAKWGIDYLKYDWCSYENIHDKYDTGISSFQKPYVQMMVALQKQDRDIIYSLCQYGMKDVWTWGAEVNGNCWRTTGDISDSWESLSSIGFGQTRQTAYAKPGRWNDPDMMIVGQVGWGSNTHPTRLTPDEQYTHLSLWCLLNAPLLIGCDLNKLDDFTLNLLTNDEVIALDQDPLGKQAKQVLKTDTSQVWMKELEDGSRALGLFNLSDKDEVVRFYWNNLSLPDGYKVRDLWRQNDLGFFKTMFAAKVAAHGVSLIRIMQ